MGLKPCSVEELIGNALQNIDKFLQQNRGNTDFDYLLEKLAKPQLRQALARMEVILDDGK